jgi:hypothetical protein
VGTVVADLDGRFQGECVSVIARPVARDGQSQADAAGFRIVRLLEVEERPEHLLALVDRDARPVDDDDDFDDLVLSKFSSVCTSPSSDSARVISHSMASHK